MNNLSIIAGISRMRFVSPLTNLANKSEREEFIESIILVEPSEEDKKLGVMSFIKSIISVFSKVVEKSITCFNREPKIKLAKIRIINDNPTQTKNAARSLFFIFDKTRL